MTPRRHSFFFFFFFKKNTSERLTQHWHPNTTTISAKPIYYLRLRSLSLSFSLFTSVYIVKRFFEKRYNNTTKNMDAKSFLHYLLTHTKYQMDEWVYIPADLFSYAFEKSYHYFILRKLKIGIDFGGVSFWKELVFQENSNNSKKESFAYLYFIPTDLFRTTFSLGMSGNAR